MAFRFGDRAVYIALGLLSSLIVILAYWVKPSFLVMLELKATDAMFMARGATPAPSEVAIVAVDEKSINEIGRWPWPRKTTARLIENLSEARTVALDIVFSEPQDAASDSRLSSAIGKTGNTVAGYFYRDDSTEAPSAAALGQVGRSVIKLVEFSGGVSSFDQFPGVVFEAIETNTPEIGKKAAGYGAFNIFPHGDGTYRKAHLVFQYGENLYPGLALEALRHYLGGDILLHIAPYGVDSISIGDTGIPVDESGAFTVNFYGPGGAFKTYSASDVINGKVPPGELKDRLVLVGVTEKGIYDIRPTPMDALYPGVEIHATIAGNVIRGDYLIHDSRVVGLDLLLAVIAPLAMSAVIAWTRRTYLSLIFFFILLSLVVLTDFFLFAFHSVSAGVVYPSLSLVMAYLSGEAYRNVVVEKKSRYLKKAFSTYVSSQLVSEILKDPDRLKLGGEKRSVTILFSDIRGFTTISEALEPSTLVKLLNEYLNPMTRIVLEEEGMLDKYIGDAIMAIFNAPLTIEAHAVKACSAALRMKERLTDLNVEWKKDGYPRIDIGIGVNTGEAVVGNMGAELRFDYTAIGDTVNLASRLEGMNKLYGTSIIVSENTYAEAKDSFDFREIDLVKVKGKTRPIKMYELSGRKGAGGGLIEEFHSALSVYRERRFKEAKALFESMAEKGDRPSALYVQRCAEYIDAPPHDDWDGVFAAKTK